MARKKKTTSSNDPLTVDEMKLCVAMMSHEHIKDAAAEIGKSASWASNTLKKANVHAKMISMLEDRAARLQITDDRVLREMARIALANPFRMIHEARDDEGDFDLSQLTEEETAAIHSIEPVALRVDVGDDETALKVAHKIKFHDKNRALEGLAKNLGLFLEDRDRTRQTDTLALLVEQMRATGGSKVGPR